MGTVWTAGGHVAAFYWAGVAGAAHGEKRGPAGDTWRLPIGSVQRRGPASAAEQAGQRMGSACDDLDLRGPLRSVQ